MFTANKIEKVGVIKFLGHMMIIFLVGSAIAAIINEAHGLTYVVMAMCYIVYYVYQMTMFDKEHFLALLSEKDDTIMKYMKMMQNAHKNGERLNTELSESRNSASENNANFKRVEAMLGALQKQHTVLQHEKASLHDSLTKVVAERDVLKQKYSPLAETATLLEQENEALKRQLQTASTTVDTMQKVEQSQAYKFNELKERYQQLSDELERTKKSHAGTISAMKRKYEAVEIDN